MTIIINNVGEKEKRKALRRNQTAEELKLWKLVRDSRLGVKFRRQVSIGPYIADFYCREKQLVVELDGLQHIQNAEYDLARKKYFESFGIKTIRFWNHEINNDIRKVKNKIIETIKDMCILPDPLRVTYY